MLTDKIKQLFPQTCHWRNEAISSSNSTKYLIDSLLWGPITNPHYWVSYASGIFGSTKRFNLSNDSCQPK